MITTPRSFSSFRGLLRVRSSPALAGAMALLLMAGCGSNQTYLLDSDIPIPPDSPGRATSGIQRRDGLIVNLDTVFSESVDDPSVTIDGLERRFIASGWRLMERGGTESVVVAIFGKTDRRCRVRVVRNELDPSMSRVAYRVRIVESTPTDGASDPDA
ncbi:MAG: hypothetical protein CMJ23_02460 [Phycisphaerae bacterium]|nr:hypothetical protein [Phycisphaerae bacterium]